VNFKITPEIFEKFPDLNVGIVVARDIDNRGRNAEIMALMRAREQEIRQMYAADTLSQQPRIEAWRKAYSQFGAKPKKYKSSVESLYRMILKGLDLRPINKIVDIYNFISIKHMIPVGGDDLEKVEGDIILAIARGKETFIPLNVKEAETAQPGEVVYVDSKEVLCRRWNWRECEKTKMTEETKDVVLVAEGLPPVTAADMEDTIQELRQLIQRYCGGEFDVFILNRERTETEL
jgi:lysyl-tRNA synthetase class 2